MLLMNDITITICFSWDSHIFILYPPEHVGHIHISPLIIIAVANHSRCARDDTKYVFIAAISHANFIPICSYKKTDTVFIIRITICPFKILRIICASAIIGALPIHGTGFCDTKYITFGCARSVTNNH